MNIIKIVFIAFLLVTSHYLLVTLSHAVNMRSNDYRIEMGTVGSGGGKMDDPINDTYHLSSSLGQTAAREFQSNGYIVKAGFQYIHSRIPFTFTLSNTQINFGTLIPHSPATGNILLRVSFGGAGQYIVTARADSPLTEIQGTNTISFTGCDGGADTCTISNAKLWTSSSAYGFGYTMTGQDIAPDFLSSSYFRPFANRLIPEDAAIIMQSNDVTADITPTPSVPYTPAPALTGVPRSTTHEATITMKANISGLQPAGTYATVVRFLATPSF